MIRRSAVLASLALALGACHPRAPLPMTTEGAWGAARGDATRRFVLYDGLRHRATATATHLSLSVREARAQRLAKWYGWTPRELEDRLAKERAEAEEGEEFLLCFYAADPRGNDLDAPRSVWRVAVKVGDVDVVARRVTSIDSDATVVGLFPYVGPFDVAYRVLLPRAPGGPIAGKPFRLELSSAQGTLSLDFAVLPKKPVDAPWQPVPAP